MEGLSYPSPNTFHPAHCYVLWIANTCMLIPTLDLHDNVLLRIGFLDVLFRIHTFVVLFS